MGKWWGYRNMYASSTVTGAMSKLRTFDAGDGNSTYSHITDPHIWWFKNDQWIPWWSLNNTGTVIEFSVKDKAQNKTVVTVRGTISLLPKK
jgi:hypothetical protein